MKNDALNNIFIEPILVNKNIICYSNVSVQHASNQEQTEKIFTDKWDKSSKIKDIKKLYDFQYDWFYRLYGFKNEKEVASFLKDKKIILDAGCGLGYKAAWFASLAPDSIVIGMDISESVNIAAEEFKHLPNLFFVQGDIANTKIISNIIDFVICDQVIMHTENPERTFMHLSDILKPGGEFGCYVYAKKALPRELIDDYFRKSTHDISKEDMWLFSEQLTELGKRLSELKVEFESPDIPLIGIKGGKYDIQRFIYWNFLKCFWKEDWGYDLSRITNYDWYAPSNAKRYSKSEFLDLIDSNNLNILYFHEEEACYSGRFNKL
jgi:SAM-dependent methyltransferase